MGTILSTTYGDIRDAERTRSFLTRIESNTGFVIRLQVYAANLSTDDVFYSRGQILRILADEFDHGS
jgi:hypothetical protein